MSTKLSKARKDLIKVSPMYEKLINSLDLKAINGVKAITQSKLLETKTKK